MNRNAATACTLALSLILSAGMTPAIAQQTPAAAEQPAAAAGEASESRAEPVQESSDDDGGPVQQSSDAAGGEPVVEAVEPHWGELRRPVHVVIKGANFVADIDAPTLVLLDGVELPEVTVVSDSEILATLPPQQMPGWAALEIRNPDNQSVTVARAFHYGPVPDSFFQGTLLQFRSFSKRFFLGGTTMWIILILSILGFAWFLHCMAYLRTSALLPDGLSNQVVTLVSRGNFGEAQKACERNKSPLSRVALAGIRRSGESPQSIAEAIEATGSRESAHLYQKISYLSNIGVITPMLGLFGTVLGMIIVFDQLANEQGAHQIVLAAGISKALYTTAFGLIVGIPAMCAYYYLKGKIVRLITDMEEEGEELARAMAAGAQKRSAGRN